MSFISRLFRRNASSVYQPKEPELELERLMPLPIRRDTYSLYDADWIVYEKPKENAMTSVQQEVANANQFSRGNARFTAQAIIHNLSTKQQYITADDVQRELVALGYKVSDLGNAAGAIFRGNEYVTKVEGVTVRSKRAGRRGSVIGVYSSNTYESNPYVYPDTWARAYNEAK